MARGARQTEEQLWNTQRGNGVEPEYEIVGWGDAILLIHGAHLADALRPLVSEPALQRFQHIRYHRRGLGGSTYPDDAGPTPAPDAGARVGGGSDRRLPVTGPLGPWLRSASIPPYGQNYPRPSDPTLGDFPDATPLANP